MKVCWLRLFAIYGCFFLFIDMRASGLESIARPLYPELVQIPENSIAGTIIGNVTDQAPAPGSFSTLRYDGIDQAFVVTPAGTGVWHITLNRTLDRERQADIHPSFTAVGPPLAQSDKSFTVFIVVTDVNDNAPQFDSSSYNLPVFENVTAGTTVFRVSATDSDIDARNHAFDFSMQVGSTSQSSPFSINSSTGDIILQTSLDFETTTAYTYTITATDHGSPPLSSTAKLYINVLDVQDTPPAFTNDPYIASVQESAALHSTVLKVKAIDGDRGVPDTVTYSIINTTCAGLFALDANSGTLTVISILDFSVPLVKTNNGLCSLIIQATELTRSGYPQHGKFTATASATITITDVNNSPPVFSASSVTASINENAPTGTPLELSPPLNVSDADMGKNSEITLSVRGEGDAFDLVAPVIQSSGTVLLRVKNSTYLDFESRQTVTAQIFATDGTNAAHSVTLTVTINNTNEFSPQFNQSQYNINVHEGTAASTSVTQLTALDRDAGPFGIVTYGMSNSDKFTINTQSGVVSTVSSTTDREQLDQYFLVVTATDGGGLKQTTVLHVNITDVNDNPPVFLREEYETTLQENEATFGRTVTVQATDADQPSSPNSRVTYSLTGTTPAGLSSHFNLDSNRGQLTVVTPFDFEKITWGPGQVPSVISVTVAAMDQGIPRMSSTVSVKIILNDINDNAPIFTHFQGTYSITENQGPNIPVVKLHASDRDSSSPNNDVFYSIASGSDDYFSINSSTGEITTTKSLDREKTSSYVLTVLAVDKGSPALTATATVSVSVLDVNDVPPAFPISEITIERPESGAGVILYNLIASDPDANAHLVYSILWNHSSGIFNSNPVDALVLQNSFMIVPQPPTLRAGRRLDRELMESAKLMIEVNDTNAASGPQHATMIINVQVQDRNDNPPSFGKTLFVANITENYPAGTPIELSSLITVHDNDKDENADFSLTLSDYTTCLDVFPTTARSDANLLIRINNQSCFDYEKIQSMNFSLWTLRATLIAPAKRTKRMEIGVIVWTPTIISAVSLVDKLAFARYTGAFQVIARDNASPYQSATASVFLHILNVNDETPSFHNETQSINIHENVNIGSFVFQAQATDKDLPPFNVITYTIQGGNDAFAINRQTGVVTLVSSTIDREHRDQYCLVVTATDGGGLKQTTVLDVTITDVNDNPPVFLRDEYETTLLENAFTFGRPVTVQARDADQPGGPNSQVTYSLTGTTPVGHDSHFHIDPSGGQLTLRSPVDFTTITWGRGEIPLVISLTVTARDGGSPQLSSAVSVQILLI